MLNNRKSALIVGGGAIAIDVHLPRLRGILGATEILIVEPSQARRAELEGRLRKMGVRIAGELPKNQSFDYAVVASPPKFHFDYFRHLKDSVDHLIIEKPMTRNFAEADLLVREAAASRSRVYVNLPRRCLDSYRMIRTIKEEGVFGPLRRVSYKEGSMFNWKVVSMGSFSKDLNGGGALIDMGPHGLDALKIFLTGLELVSTTMDAGGEAIEANARLQLKAEGDIEVEFEVSRNRFLSNRCRVEFANAVVACGNSDNELRLTIGNSTMQLLRNKNSALLSGNVNALFSKFYTDYVKAGRNEEVGPANAADVMRIIDAAYSQAEIVPSPF